MSYSLTWLPDVLRAAGLNVVETPGWQTRGHGDMGTVRGVMLHDCAGPLHQSVSSLEKILINGRPDLQGPLAQLGLEEDGTYYVIAAGRCWHAGVGNWKGVTTGNASFIGIEAVNTGLKNDPWDVPQMDAYVRGVAAILQHIGASVDMVVRHAEYALPKGRKTDPSFDGDVFRAKVSTAMNTFNAKASIVPALEKKGTMMFDPVKFEEAFAAALPVHEEMHVATLASLGAPAPAKGLQGGFCANWPKIEGTLNAILSIPLIGWFVPGFSTFAPMIRAFLTAADQTLIPSLCPAHEAK